MALAGRGPITHVSSPLDLADTCLEVDTCTILCVFFLLFTFFHLCFGPYKLLLGEFLVVAMYVRGKETSRSNDAA